MALGVLIQRGKHDRENDLNIVADQVAEVLVVPEVKSPFSDLEVGAGNRFGELMEERLLNLGELGWVHDLENVFNLIEEHNLFGTVDFGPVTQQTENHLFCQGSILLEELNNAVRKLRVVHAQALDFVEGNQHPGKEQLVLLLQGQSKAVDDGTENFQQLRDAVKALRLVGELEKHIVDRAANKGSEVEEFAVDTVEGGLQKVALPRVLRIKQLEKLEHKAVINVCLGDVCVEILALNEPEKELVHDLNMRPGNLQHRLVLFGIEGLALRVHGRRDGAEQVFGKHANHDWIHGFCDNLTVVGHIIQKLMKRQPLDLLGLHVGTGIVEIEDDVALINLLHEQILAASRGDLVKAGELLELAMSRDVKS